MYRFAYFVHSLPVLLAGKTVAENLADVASPSSDQDVIFPVAKPIAPPSRHIRILKV